MLLRSANPRGTSATAARRRAKPRWSSASRRPGVAGASTVGCPAGGSARWPARRPRSIHRATGRRAEESRWPRDRYRRGASTRVTTWQAHRSALHPWPHGRPRAGAGSPPMRGNQACIRPRAGSSTASDRVEAELCSPQPGPPQSRRRRTQPLTAAPADLRSRAAVRRGQNSSGQMAQDSWMEQSPRSEPVGFSSTAARSNPPS